ncbi:MAG: rhomboid family protein [Desulfobacterales bacterium]|nr:rhomboid family protein [Desulfobacterales bacterium]
MQDITQQRCHNHMLREAAARCPECDLFFCRECITEHEDKVLCAACLGKKREPAIQSYDRYQWMFRLGHFSLGILILYIFFYYLGQILLSFPSSFHEGTLWQSGWWTGS